MNSQPKINWKRFWHSWLAGALLWTGGTVPAHSQTPRWVTELPPLGPTPHLPESSTYLPAKRVTQQDDKDGKEGKEAPTLPPPTPDAAAPGCATCGGCGDGHCLPGRFRECCGCNSDTVIGRILCGFYGELCCPDPCYEPKFIPVASAAFFVEGTRPVTTTRIRWEYANDFTLPDRSEFFWAKIGGKGPKIPETRINYSQLSLYQEIAAKGFSFFIDMPYISVDPDVNVFAAGFGDMKVGTKSLLFDRDLFQVGFMFQTIIPSGNFLQGLGTGHVSLEPSLLATMKITPETYFQSQIAEWIPLGGDPDYQGSILHYHFSLNHILCKPVNDVQLIGTGEFTGYSFQAGRFTDPVLGPNQRSNGTAYLTLGPGLRLVICEWLDFGFGAAFALGDHGPGQTYRTEMRIRF